MNKFKTIAAVGLALSAISAVPIYYPSVAFAEAYVGVDAQGEAISLGLDQLNQDQQTEAWVKADNVHAVLKQINRGSKARVLFADSDVEALVIGGKCPPGKVAQGVVRHSGPVVLRCY